MPHASSDFVIAAVEGVTLTRWTRAWEERMPAVPLRVVRTTAADQVQALGDAPADVAFVRLPVDDTSLSVIPLYEELAFAVVPKDHPASALDILTLADLDGENVLGGSWASAIELVGANVGVALVPQSVARLYGRGDVVARPVADLPATRIALAWPTGSTTDEVEVFIGIVRGRTAQSSRDPARASDSSDDERKRAASKGKPAPSERRGQVESGRAKRLAAAEARAAANRRKRARGKG